MKNKHALDLNVLKMIKSLSQGKCAGCVFNKLGTCSLLQIHQLFNENLSNEDLMSCKACSYKITHQDLSDFMVDDFLYAFDSEKPISLTSLSLLCEKINYYKECTNNENL